MDTGLLGMGWFLVWRPGVGPPLQVGLGQTGQWSEEGKRAKAAVG